MSKVHGKKAYLKIGTTVVSGQMNSISVDGTKAADDATPFGVEDEEFLAGLGTGDISAAGFIETSNAVALEGYLGTIVAYEYGPAGNTTGSIKKSGNCLVTACNYQQTPTAASAFTLTAKRSGAETVGTY